MRVYRIGETCSRRYLSGGVLPVGEVKPCPCGRNNVNYPPPESYWKNVELDQGSFVSNILWWTLFNGFHVTEELKDSLQKEGFEGLAFEPTVIVKDSRPSKDKKKLPLEQIPQFYRVKFLTFIPLHHDFIELYDPKYCPECGRDITPRDVPPPILNAKSHPGTDFFRVERYGVVDCCTERGKAFLENYPKTFCRFTQVELRG